MKNLILLVILSIALVQCSSSNPCEGVTCEFDMPCVEGDCECATGLSGERCEIADRDIFLGVWEGIIQCTPDNMQESLLMDVQRSEIDWHSVNIFFNGSEEAIVGTVADDNLLVADLNVNTGTFVFTKASFSAFFINSNTINFQLESDGGLITGPVFCNATLVR